MVHDTNGMGHGAWGTAKKDFTKEKHAHLF